MDEIDILLRKIYRNEITSNYKYPKEVYDKSTWNRFLDNFDRGYYPWVTLIMTSNRTIEQIDEELDSSFLRHGRVDQYFTL